MKFSSKKCKSPQRNSKCEKFGREVKDHVRKILPRDQSQKIKGTP
jgi:hypothetical protein